MNATTHSPNEISEEILQIIEKTKSFFLNKETPLYELKKISSEKIEALYERGYSFYITEKYREAAAIFDVLVFYNHTDLKNWMGYAASYQMLQEYEKALYGYSKAFSLERSNPAPIIHMFECYIELKEYSKAVAALESVILIAKNKPEYSEVVQQAGSLITHLKETHQEIKTLAPL